MSAHKAENFDRTFILTIIDCFSKFAFAVPLKNKSSEIVARAMEFVFTKSNKIPSKLQTDAGKEFYNKTFGNLMKKYKIHHYSSFSQMKVIKHKMDVKYMDLSNG